MSKPHLTGIDGLKGIAILAVVFTHIPLNIWYQFIPKFLQWPISLITKSGGVGVTIFFITTGFLMGYLYPRPVSALDFYARRYARLFPAFLVMVVSFTLFRLVQLPMIVKPLVVLGLAWVMRWFWSKFSSQNRPLLMGKKPIYWLLLIQAAVACGYIFYLQKIPASVFYIKWHPALQTFITFLVNATLTLPFGKYIDQLDGIYWALCAELIFYLLYPILIVPLIQSINKTSNIIKSWLFLMLVPFCFGLLLLNQRVLGFGMLNLHLIIYFIVGAYIGINYTSINQKLKRFALFLGSPGFIAFALVAVFCSVLVDEYISEFCQKWLAIIMVLPTSLLLIAATVVRKKSRTWLEFRPLSLLGKYSYAIFLTHSLIIQTVLKKIPADNGVHGAMIVVFSLLGTLVLSFILHQLMEKPYFVSRKKQVVNNQIQYYHHANTSKRCLIYLILVLFLMADIAFRVPVAFFTMVYRQGGEPIWSIFNQSEIILSDKPWRQPLLAKENNLGMVTTHIKKEIVPEKLGGIDSFLLNIRLLDDQQKVISQSSYQAHQILDDWYLPFGFPIEADSRGKNYIVEYQLSKIDPAEEIIIIKNESDLIMVHFFDKKTLFTNPGIFLSWLVNKLGAPMTSTMYWMTILHWLPLSGLLFALQRRKSI